MCSHAVQAESANTTINRFRRHSPFGGGRSRIDSVYMVFEPEYAEIAQFVSDIRC